MYVTTRRLNQSILKEINPEYSVEGLMLKLKLQYFGHLMRRADSLEKTLMLGKIEGRRRGDDRGWDDWMASLTQWTWVWAPGDGEGQGSLACCSPWGRRVRLRDWTRTSFLHVGYCRIVSRGPCAAQRVLADDQLLRYLLIPSALSPLVTMFVFFVNLLLFCK